MASAINKAKESVDCITRIIVLLFFSLLCQSRDQIATCLMDSGVACPRAYSPTLAGWQAGRNGMPIGPIDRREEKEEQIQVGIDPPPLSFFEASDFVSKSFDDLYETDRRGGDYSDGQTGLYLRHLTQLHYS